MNISLVTYLVILIPITALIDYFLFRKNLEQSLGYPPKWYHFIWPCAIEIGMFILGYLFGSGTCP